MNLFIRVRSLWAVFGLLALTHSGIAQSSRAVWIWYPGDFDIWLSNQVQARRTERSAFVPPFWRVYNFNPQVNFSKQLVLTEPETLTVTSEGVYNVTVDGKYVQQSSVQKLTIPAGTHSINFQVYNAQTPPAILVQGKTVNSDASWTVELIHNNNPDNIPKPPTTLVAGAENFARPEAPPSSFKLATIPKAPLKTERIGKGYFVDFGQETFGYVQLKNLKGTGTVSLYYGESPEEARSVDSCETFDRVPVFQTNAADFTVNHSRAFRYVQVQVEGDVQFEGVSMLYEYAPLSRRGSFKSSDEQLNTIWETAAYTLQLATREFFLDGIKRDRWVWSGDANQSYLMNYYLFFDNPTVKRTTWALRGSDPVESHINTILDYSFYWFVSIYDYYLYSGDTEFLRQIYPKMQSLMEFCLSRRNANGMVEGLPGDWVFLDWATMPKDGELSAEQLLFCRSLEAMTLCANLMNDTAKASEYQKLATELRAKIMTTFWDPSQKALLHSRKNGQLNPLVTRYPNLFAMLFGYLDAGQTEAVRTSVFLNDKILKINTPYMRFYELEALCSIGQQAYVTKEIKDYWGGMLKEGATSFWEFYDPAEKGAARYAMYGRPFGKSLCHAWGASPVYLLGKYYLGVKPLKAGYEEYAVEPSLGGLQWIEGKVPTPQGEVAVAVNARQISVTGAQSGRGILRFRSETKPDCPQGTVAKTGDKSYELALEKGKSYVVTYAMAK